MIKLNQQHHDNPLYVRPSEISAVQASVDIHGKPIGSAVWVSGAWVFYVNEKVEDILKLIDPPPAGAVTGHITGGVGNKEFKPYD